MTPVSDEGRIILIFMILLAMFLIPYQSYKLIQLLTKRSEYAGSVSFHSNSPKHIVILGDISTHRLLHLFRELFHKDQNYRNIRVVILSQKEPAEETKKLLFHPFYKSRIIFLVGSPLKKRDLKRIALAHCTGCLILTDQYSTNVKNTDRRKFIPIYIYNHLHTRTEMANLLYLLICRYTITTIGYKRFFS